MFILFLIKQNKDTNVDIATFVSLEKGCDFFSFQLKNHI